MPQSPGSGAFFFPSWIRLVDSMYLVLYIRDVRCRSPRRSVD